MEKPRAAGVVAVVGLRVTIRLYNRGSADVSPDVAYARDGELKFAAAR